MALYHCCEELGLWAKWALFLISKVGNELRTKHTWFKVGCLEMVGRVEDMNEKKSGGENL